jgi:hypothetical protein
VRALRSRFDAGDRMLGWAPASAGYLVASLAALWWIGEAGGVQNQDGVRRLGWDRIDRAVWADPVLLVHPAESGQDAWRVFLDDPGRMPALVRDRVQASIAVNAVRRLSTGSRVRIVARRRYGVDGLVWAARFEGAADAADPAMRAEADAAIAEQQALLGE